MADAQYEVLVPCHDTLGNSLVDLAPHAVKYITKELRINTAHVDSKRRVFWDGREEMFDALIFTAEDKPQTDSVAKQLASYLGEVANQDVVLVSKHGKSGLQSWPIRNREHRPGEPAESIATNRY